MKNEKGITFKYISEIDAENYLTNVNNYLRTAAYRKNYQKHTNGNNIGKYICLDFAYLQELSTLDMHFRFVISKMCSDIEHALKVKMLKDIENDISTDGYDIVKNFLAQNTYIIEKLEATSASPFTSDLIHKYFTIQRTYNPAKQRNENKIVAYDDCPAWVLLEMLTFGDFIKFYEFYYSQSNFSKINSIKSNQRQKKLSCRPMLKFTCMLYVYKIVVSDKVTYHRIIELKDLFFKRMLEKKSFFSTNELIKSNYEFACKVITAFF